MKHNTLFLTTVRTARSNKVCEIAVKATSFGRGASTIVDMHVTCEGRSAIESIGAIEPSSHPGYTHAFYPNQQLRNAGVSSSRGSLAEARMAAVAAAMFRVGAAQSRAAQQVNA